MRMLTFLTLLLIPLWARPAEVTIGSKAFTEGYLLAEFLAQHLEVNEGARVERRFGMGATGILFEALKSGSIDFYPEYTGTISQAILKRPDLKSHAEIQSALSEVGLRMSPPLGFENNYALAVSREFSEKHGLQRISDLRAHQGSLRTAFGYEFSSREDGLRPLLRHYNIQFAVPPKIMEHSLGYRAISNQDVDVIDVYSTDAKIKTLDLVVLEDDLDFFTKYQAVILATETFVRSQPALWSSLANLEQSLSAEIVRDLNSQVDDLGQNFAEVIRGHLKHQSDDHPLQPIVSRIKLRTKEHSLLVGVALLFSILIGLPLGVLAARQKTLGQVILLLSGMIQTIPSLALLCFLIPLFGIGVGSALVALCLYGLLPVVMGTFVGLRSIDPVLLEMSRALGLTSWQSLIRIEIPLASRNILAGVRTSAVIGIGTATLAALIGAGGYGATIVAGLAINDTTMILQGAVPAASMALVVHGLFEILNLILTPRGIR